MKFRFAFIFILVAGCSVLVAAQSNKNEETFKSLVKQLADAQVAFDQAKLDKLFTPDYIEISPIGEFDSRAKVLGFYSAEAKAAMGNMKFTIEPAEYSIRDYGKYAIAIVRLNSTITKEGTQMPPRSMRATFVFRKSNDDWRIASAQYTGITESAAASTK